ncbi:11333_t:CDS:2, partial [Gigaspora rosea]
VVGGLRLFLVGWVVFGEFTLLLVVYFWSTSSEEGTGYVLFLRVKTYELAVLDGRKGKGG